MKRILFTRAEVIEVIRALELISMEDDNCDVNMEPDAVAAKHSALAKLEAASGLRGPEARMKELLKDAESFDVRTGDARRFEQQGEGIKNETDI